jgi:hypothetical protein
LAAPKPQPDVCALRLISMKTPFWRCAIISLLLWALPVQWLAAAASLPCAGHTEAQGEALAVTMAHEARGHEQKHALQGEPQQLHQQEHGQQGQQGQYGHNGRGHDLGSVALAHADADADTGAMSAQNGSASGHSHAQCATSGHCCPSVALLPAAMPDFALHSAAAQFAPLTQPHRPPLLSGPDRPPQTPLA